MERPCDPSHVNCESCGHCLQGSFSPGVLIAGPWGRVWSLSEGAPGRERSRDPAYSAGSGPRWSGLLMLFRAGRRVGDCDPRPATLGFAHHLASWGFSPHLAFPMFGSCRDRAGSVPSPGSSPPLPPHSGSSQSVGAEPQCHPSTQARALEP